jgi:hypothetical protein
MILNCRDPKLWPIFLATLKCFLYLKGVELIIKVFLGSSQPSPWWMVCLESYYLDSYRLNALSSVPTLSLYDMLLVTRGLNIWFVHVLLVICPHLQFLLFAWTWVIPFVSYLPPFLTVFLYWWLARFHHLIIIYLWC